MGFSLGGAFSQAKQSQDSWSRPGYTKYQEGLQKFLTPQFQDTLMGFDSPMMRTLSQIAQNSARKETLPARKQFLEGYNMTGPAKAEMMNKLLPAQIGAGAEAGQAAWKAALEFLTGVAGQTPSQFSQSKGRAKSFSLSGSLGIGEQAPSTGGGGGGGGSGSTGLPFP